MSIDTLQAAKERVLEDHPNAHFLTSEEVVPGKNVYFLEVQRNLRRQPYLSAFGSIVKQTSGGRVRMATYAYGNQTRLTDLQTIYVLNDDAWCKGEPIFSHCHCSDYIEGIVYWKRHKYIRKYDVTLQSEEVEQLAEQDWQSDPTVFTLKA
jgi:hypothetical protein